MANHQNWLTIIFISLCFNVFAQKSDNRLTIGVIDSVYSPTLKEIRKIWVYVPEKNGSGANAEHRFPVVYLLDGNAHFYSVAAMIQQLSEVNKNAVCPDMVVVGILNTDRTRDMTPTHGAASYYFNADAIKTAGGAENFTTFIQKELMPYVEAHYPVSSYRTLIGHSFAGLFVMNTLIKHPDLFSAYVAIDPSLWWDNQIILKQAELTLEQNKLIDKSLFFAVAHTMEPSMDTAHVVYDTTGATLHMRSNLLFTKYLMGRSNNGLRKSWKYYDNDNHFSVPLIAEYDALHFLFDYYPFSEGSFDQLTADVMAQHYETISEKIGYIILPPEALINDQGYVWLQRKVFDKAYFYFKLNIDNYPNNANEYDSMGDLYIAKGDNKKAIEYLTKALACKDVTLETKQKLEKLRAMKVN
jgi:predicted alpha/beta superfamily hydrolase